MISSNKFTYKGSVIAEPVSCLIHSNGKPYNFVSILLEALSNNPVKNVMNNEHTILKAIRPNLLSTICSIISKYPAFFLFGD